MSDGFMTEIVIHGDMQYNVRELSLRERRDAFKAFNDNDNDVTLLQAHFIKAGCAEMSGMSTDDILDLPGRLVDKLYEAIDRLSSPDVDPDNEKKSES